MENNNEHLDRIVNLLPPGMASEAHECAQEILDALMKEDTLIPFVALKAAEKAYLLHTDFPREGLTRFFAERGMPLPPELESWEAFEASMEEQIQIIVDKVSFDI